MLERLAVQCLSDVPGTLTSFRLVPADTMPYLRAALTDEWIGRGTRVALPTAEDLTTLRYDIDHTGVRYRRLGRRLHERTISLGIDYTLSEANGGVLDDGVCSEMVVDTVRVRDLSVLEDLAYPETAGQRPPAGWFRRYLEPVVLGGAVAVAVLLFFSLRSDRGDS